MIVIFILVITYEYKISKIIKNNKQLRANNDKLAGMVANMAEAGDDLIISYKTLFEVARERFSEEEIEELFAEKMENVLIQHVQEKENRDARYSKRDES